MIIAALVVAAAMGGQDAVDEIALPACGLAMPITRRLLAALPDGRFTGAARAFSH